MYCLNVKEMLFIFILVFTIIIFILQITKPEIILKNMNDFESNIYTIDNIKLLSYSILISIIIMILITISVCILRKK